MRIKTTATGTHVAMGTNSQWLGMSGSKASAAFSGNVTEATGSINDGAWHMLTASRRSAIMYVLVDGVARANGASSGSLSGASGWGVGAFQGGGFDIAALIKTVGMWNVGLSDAAILSMFHSGIAPAGLVGFWDFNEGSGSSALDSSGNGNTASIIGATYSIDVPVIA
jgi:hypothetical protein